MGLSPGKGELEAAGKGGLSLSCLTLTACAKENIAGIFLALLWKADPAGSHERASNPIRVRNAKEKQPGKVFLLLTHSREWSAFPCPAYNSDERHVPLHFAIRWDG